MQAKDLIQVLWVENDPVVIDAYPYEAEEYGLLLVPFPCFDDAYKALQEDYQRWDAIILDAKCKVKDTDIDKAIPFLTQSISRIAELAKDNNKTINWYILSGQGEEAISDAIPDTRLAWDKDWTDSKNKKFYSKESDREILFMRIRAHYRNTYEFQVKNDLYNKIFTSLDYIGISEYTEPILLDILLPLHFHEKQTTFRPAYHYNQLRQLIEYLFRACHKVGLIPDECIPNGNVNLNQCSIYLAGKNAEKAGVRYGEPGERVIPEYIEAIIRSVLDFGNVHSHTVELDAEDTIKIENILRSSQSKYLIFGLTLQLCEAITWFAKYISEHDDKEVNLLYCQGLIKDDDKAKYEGKICVPEQDENGVWHCEECLVILSHWESGRMKLKEISDNTNKRTNGKYPYFAKFDKVE
jgi:hypothetical protein